MRRALCCAVATLVTLGCSGGLVDANGNTGVKKIGAAGGEVKTKGATLTVPEGALAETVQISITPATEGNPDGVVGTPFDISPAGTTFAKPVELALTFDVSALEAPDLAQLVRIAVLQDGQWIALEDSVADPATGIVRASTTHFSRYGVVQICGNFRACPVNQVCTRHRCRPVEVCDDGVDNDGDGLVDCADADCAQSPLCQARCCFDTIANACVNSCCQNGQCLGNCYCGSGWCSRCASGGTETACTDGVDNDGDGFIDCRDPDCAHDPACTVVHEICNNGTDDDGDGLVDCLDPDCSSDPVACPSCCFVTITNQCVASCCQNGVCQGNCFCGPQVCSRCGSTAEVCDNGVDDDHDGLIDCLDPDCAASTACAPAQHELNCADGIDNDRDGQTDCQDTDCQTTAACTCTGSPGCCYPRCSATETLVCLGANICGYPCHCEAKALDGGSAPPAWYQTCGDPVCHGWTSKPGVPLCTAAQLRGSACTTVGEQCDPHDQCNALLQCATSDPRMGTVCPISRTRFKEDINFLEPAELQRYHDELVSLPLATYRYKQGDARLHLGFMIDGHESMIAVQPDRDQVDVYGYASMAVAAIKVQAAQIEEMKKELAALKADCARPRAGKR